MGVGGTPASSDPMRLPARPDPVSEILAGHAQACKTCHHPGDWPTWRPRWCQLASAWRAPPPRTRARGGALHVVCHGDARAAPLLIPDGPRPAEAEAGRGGGPNG